MRSFMQAAATVLCLRAPNGRFGFARAPKRISIRQARTDADRREVAVIDTLDTGVRVTQHGVTERLPVIAMSGARCRQGATPRGQAG